MNFSRLFQFQFPRRTVLCLALTLSSVGCTDDDGQGPTTPVGTGAQGQQPAAPGPGMSSSDAGTLTPGAQPPPEQPRDAASSGTGSSDASTDAGSPAPSEAGLPAMYEAVQAIRDAFRDNAYDSYAALAKGIDAASKAHPDDPNIARYSAVLRLWRLTESTRDPKFGLLDAAPVLLEAQARFETARRLAPGDGRLNGWSAALTLRSGQALGLSTQIDAGKRELEASIAAYPAFNLFVQGASLSALPRTDPDFAKATDKMYATLKECGYALDPQKPVLPADAMPTVSGGVCGNSSYAPHNLEGLFLNFGDAMVKAGKPDIAKVLYGNAQTRSSYATWPYRPKLEERITNAEKNAASFADTDPANDFKMPIEDGYFCVTCHAIKL